MYKHTLLVIGIQFCLLSFIVFKVSHLLYYDELLHAVAAQKLLSGDAYLSSTHEVLGHTILGHRVPLFILYYVGAPKTYALSFWFWIFGSSVEHLRLFTALCGALFSGLLFYCTSRFFSRTAGWIAFALLAFDPSFVLSRVFDWGPLALQDVMKVSLLICFFYWLEHRRKLLLWVMGLLSGMLLWDKLNAWWFLAPLFVVMCHRQWKDKQTTITHYIFGLVIGSFPLFLLWLRRPWFYSESLKSFAEFENYAYAHRLDSAVWNLLKNYVSGWDVRIETLWQVLNGSAIPRHILIEPYSFTSPLPFVFGFCLMILLFYRNALTMQVKIILFICGGIVISLLLTRHANGIHHYLMFYPFIQIISGVVLARLYRSYQKAVVFLLTTVLCTNLLMLVSFWERTTALDTVRAYWRRDRIDAFIHETVPGHKSVALDWGISLPVAFLSNGTIAVQDLQPFYQPQCQKVAKKIVDGYQPILYEYPDRVFLTYYVHCQPFFRNF